ncbi:MAG: hypothetical protein F6J95_026125 [Leptolyngbya sp. SIO1E4]|nr:hypothetical protein [Leptolyngbya sp. SIO1E4]
MPDFAPTTTRSETATTAESQGRSRRSPSASPPAAGMPLFLQSQASDGAVSPAASEPLQSLPDEPGATPEPAQLYSSLPEETVSSSHLSETTDALSQTQDASLETTDPVLTEATLTEQVAEEAALSEPAERELTRLVGGGRAILLSRRQARLAGELDTLLPAEVSEPEPMRPLVVQALALPSFTGTFPPIPGLEQTALPVSGGAANAPNSPQTASPQQTADLDAAFQTAQQQYQETLQQVQQHQATLMRQGNQATDQLRQTYQQAANQVPRQIEQADAALNEKFQQARRLVLTAAGLADTVVLRDYAIARQQLNRATRSARGAVDANARTAQTQIDQIVTSLSSKFVGTLTDAQQTCVDSADYAARQIIDWETNLNRNFPISGSGEQQASNEAKRKAAPRLTQPALSQLNQRRNDAYTRYGDNITQVQGDVRNSVGPTLQNRAGKIRTEGNASITKALGQAKKGLQAQANQARFMLMQMRTDSLEQFTAQQEAVRSQLFSTGQQAISEMQRQARTAGQVTRQTIQQGLPHYHDGVVRLHGRLTQAAASGPAVLETTASDAAPRVQQQVATGRQLQSEQLRMVQAGATQGMQQRQQQVAENVDARVTTAQTGIAASQAQAAKAFANSEAALTRGFSKVSQGVTQVGEAWAQPLAEVFKDYLAESRTQIESTHPQFLGQISTSVSTFTGWVQPHNTPDTFFASALTAAWTPIRTDLERRTRTLATALTDAGVFNDTDEAGVTGSLRGLTRAQGNFIRQQYQAARRRSLDTVLREELWDDDDYYAAINYLNGNRARGAQFELQASIHWYNDEESRIEGAMRALSTEDLRSLHQLDRSDTVLEDVQDALGGTDRQVFDALSEANNEARFARADAFRLRDRINEARRRDDDDALNTALAEYSRAAQAQQFGGQTITAAERRRLVQQEFAHIQGIDLDAMVAQGTPMGRAGEQRAVTTREEAAAQALFGYATRDIEQTRSAGQGHTYTVTLSVEGAQEDLARALIFQGEQSAETRAARLGVEIERSGDPNILNLDTALVDPRLNPDFNAGSPAATAQARQQAQQEREAMFRIFAERYGSAGTDASSTTAAQGDLVQQLRQAYDSDTKGADLAEALVVRDYPTPATAAIAMEYAIAGLGTNNALIDRTLGRMNRDEIAAMRSIYDAQPGRDLYDDLGVYGQGTFGDLSGDDRLRAERMLLGQPRNDRERAEVAAFAVEQQRRESSGLGSSLASDSAQADFLAYDERRLSRLTGTEVSFENGIPTFQSRSDAFDDQNRFTGDRAEFQATTASTQLSAQNYAAKIDQYATVAATTVAIAGAIAAAVATVTTGGAASPLLLAAIAGISGLAGMGAQAAIRGGRYGWEDAAKDLGMTAVQALTAGVGQGLGLASRGGAQGLQAGMRAGLSISAARQLSTGTVLGQMGRLTGSEFADKLLIGMATGALGSFGQTALTEATYSQGGGKAFENLMASLFRGALSGGVTAGVSNALEDLPLQRLPGLSRVLGDRTLGENIGQSTSYLGRSLGKSVSSSTGAFAGRSAELGFESARGTYRGDAGDIFVSSLESAGQAALQGVGEGTGEARTQRGYNRWREASQRAAERIPETSTLPRPTDADPDTLPDTPNPRSPISPDADTTPMPRVVVDEPSARPADTIPDTPLPQVRETLPDSLPDVRAADQPDIRNTLADAVPASIRPADLADTVPTPMRPIDLPEATPPAPRPTPVAEGTAAAVAGSRFRGDVQINSSDRIQTAAARAIDRLIDSGGPLAGKAITGDDQSQILLQTLKGDVIVHISVADNELPNNAVARFDLDADTGEYQIRLSPRAHPDMVERALAHELTEIRFAHNRENTSDFLKPGGFRNRPPEDGTTPQLSPHDQGRLAELDVIARQLRTVDADAPELRARLRDEAERLAAHLGLVGDSDAVVARRQAALDALSDRAATRALLSDAIGGAETNPFLQRRSDDLNADFELLARRLALAQQLDDRALIAQVVEMARQSVISRSTIQHYGSQIRSSAEVFTFLNGLAKSSSPALRALGSRTLEVITNPPPARTGMRLRGDPADVDPHQPEVVRQQFGDRPHFQEWAEFRQRFFDSRSSYDRTNPEHLADAFARWSAGGYVADSGTVSSLAASSRRPDPGYEATYLPGKTPQPDASALPDDTHTLPTGETVADAVQDRRDLIQNRDTLQTEFDNPQTTAARRTEIETELNQIGRAINVRSEQLGEAAGRQVAENHPDGPWQELKIPRSGSGVPDLMYEAADGRLLIIEAKGGTSELGTRLSTDGTRRVEQGHRDYLESLAAAMSRSSDPDIRRLGAKIEVALRGNPPAIDYMVVRQPFQDDGSLATPVVGTFDIRRGGSSRPPLTAGAVPGSQFRGDVLDTARDHQAVTREIRQALGQISRNTSLIDKFTLGTSLENSYIHTRTATGDPPVRVRIEIVDDIGTEPGDVGVPVGRIHPPDETRDHYLVRLSAKAPEGFMERALAHELTEIHRMQGTERLPDRLRPGSFSTPDLTSTDPPPRLSPHDYGRIAELDVLTRQIEVAEAQKNIASAEALKKETRLLLEHLGLEGDTPDAISRRAFVRSALAEDILKRVWESFYPPPKSQIATDSNNSIERQNQRLSQLQQEQRFYFKNLSREKASPEQILGALSAEGFSYRSVTEASRLDQETRILYLGEGRLEHLEKYKQLLPADIKVTTLVTEDDFQTQIGDPKSKLSESDLEVFQSNIDAIRNAGIDLETGFDALKNNLPIEENPYDQIRFDFPRVDKRDVSKNVHFTQEVMEQMFHGGFIHQESVISITLGLENLRINPLQLLGDMHLQRIAEKNSSQSFELQELILIHNKEASEGDSSRIGTHSLKVPFSIQMIFKPSPLLRGFLPLKN